MYRDLLAIVTSTESDAHVLDCAEQIAAARGSFLTGLAVNWIPALPTVIEGWVVDTRWGELVAEAQAQVEAEQTLLGKRIKNTIDRSASESLLIEVGAARDVLALRARHADLTFVARPDFERGNFGQVTILEAALFRTGRPVMIVPPGYKKKPIGSNVVVAWDASKEAARALADASALIGNAEKVTIVTVDAKPSSGGHGDLPGMDISAHLARCGMEVELRNVDSAGRRESVAILDEVGANSADLLVMGGYGRARMSELIFGGVTRDIIGDADVPVLMSH